MQFLEQHFDTFDANDENKLEYTEIHSRYVYILDEVIETNLRSKYSEDEVKNFYDTFKDNLQRYEEENHDGLDCLFGFLDFDKFKTYVLKLKAGKFEYTPKELEEGTDQMLMKDTSSFEEYLAEDVNNKKLGWKKILTIKEKKNILVSGILHQRKMQGSKIDLMRSDLTFRGVSLKAFQNMTKSMEKTLKN